MGLEERRKREIRERHDQIMDAARMVLFKHGMPMASIKRIAQAAELGVFHAARPRRQAVILWTTLHDLIQFRKIKKISCRG